MQHKSVLVDETRSTFGPLNGLYKLDICDLLISENNTAGPGSPAVQLT